MKSIPEHQGGDGGDVRTLHEALEVVASRQVRKCLALRRFRLKKVFQVFKTGSSVPEAGVMSTAPHRQGMHLILIMYKSHKQCVLYCIHYTYTNLHTGGT
jgi:hypothetical protein